MDAILNNKIFVEPRMVIFKDTSNSLSYIVAEKEVLFEVNNCAIVDCLTSLIASYYVMDISYPKSSIAAAELLFIQEILLGVSNKDTKKKIKYTSLFNSIVD